MSELCNVSLSHQRSQQHLYRSRSTRSFAQVTGSFFRSTCNRIGKYFSRTKRKGSTLSPEIGESSINGEVFRRYRRRRTNNYEMNNLDNDALELDLEAQTLDEENEVI